ncbi:c-type cytochrome [Steroidobacter sp.]|uniref:c-type cytochrome n=1 Tax=Steroidobacter sp. TaxID=1978227 RepID=UPI001A408B8E|nr:c-type cytochrome [Steroidobacter sp.]MBL8267620.1 c-type cytochrome [Steroidobacter sp.]
MATLAALTFAGLAQHHTAARADELPEWGPHDEYGEFLAAPAELASYSVNEIVKSMRLSAQALHLGEQVYADHCASCHGPDLKGLRQQHTPDLTDDFWRFSGDDFDSAGGRKRPSDVEWSVRYGVRSGHPNARGIEVGMLALDPKFRSPKDTADFGDKQFLSNAEISEMVEYVLQLGGQAHDASMARRAAPLFQDNAKGNCFDCHGRNATGRSTFGATDLTRPRLYIYGADRAAILESITKGRHTTMPAFEGVLPPEQIKAVSVFVFMQAAK